MPLRDHFRSPVNDKHTWDEVHGLWPGMIVRELFEILPPAIKLLRTFIWDRRSKSMLQRTRTIANPGTMRQAWTAIPLPR